MAIQPMGRAIAVWAERDGARPALTVGGTQLARSELHRRTNQLARWILSLGVSKGELVGVALPNSIEMIECVIACMKCGAKFLALHDKMPVAELAAIIDLAKPKLTIGCNNSVPGGIGISADLSPARAQSDEDLPDVVVKNWKVGTSGGSTGRPKLIWTARSSEVDIDRPWLGMELESTVLVPGPLYHGGPMAYATHSLLLGSHVIIMQRFDAEECLRLIDRHKVKLLAVVPTMMGRITALGNEIIAKYDVSSLARVVHFGASCPEWLKETWINWLGADKICEFYSTTEQLCTTWINGAEWLLHRGSVGRPISGKVKIVDASGELAAPGEVGELYMMPDTGTGTSYIYTGAESKRAPDGWETVGDMGYLDDDGYLYIADRRTDMIVRGGANVYPAEVEGVLMQHPSVNSCAVIGLADPDLGHRVHAIIHLTRPLEADVLREWLRERLVRYKIPSTFEFVSEPLHNESGKLRRSALREARMNRTPAAETAQTIPASR
jgi:bile acid-coenzyme A ligase